jgi:hypothetical protein
MKQDVFGRTDIILHRRDIVRREGPFAALRDRGKRDEFDTALLGALRTMPCLVNTVVIDKREHLERYATWHFDPYHYCLHCLVERYVMWLRRRQLTGDVLIEQRGKQADKKVKASFRKIYAEGTFQLKAKTFQDHLTSGEIKFVRKTDNIAAMQVCDLIAHPSYRHMKFERLEMEQPKDFGTSIVEVLIEKRYARNPKTHKIPGWGRKWLP